MSTVIVLTIVSVIGSYALGYLLAVHAHGPYMARRIAIAWAVFIPALWIVSFISLYQLIVWVA